MRQQSESWLLLPLLPIFLVGMFPMLMISLLGFAGLALFGVLLVCVGLASSNEAHDSFNRDVIVRGPTRGSERTARVSDMHAATRLGLRLDAAGLVMIAAGIAGLIYSG